MNFLERNGANLRPGNVVFTMILLSAILGMTAWCYTAFMGLRDRVPLYIQPGAGTFEGLNYTIMASIVTTIVASGAALGIMVGKANNDFMGGSRVFETVALFVLVLIIVVILCCAFTPQGVSADDNSDNDMVYEAALLSLSSIMLGMITVMSGMNKEYKILGTSLFLALVIIALGLMVNAYVIIDDDDNIDATGVNTDHLSRTFAAGEKNVVITIFSLAAVVVAAGVLHLLLERKEFRKLLGRKASPRRSSPRRSPARKTKLGTLKPGRK